MEQKRQFKNRTERLEYYQKLRGEKPLTKEEERQLFECLKMITNFKPSVIAKYENTD
ncbi:MAG: hypothetical protein J6T70_14835 [Bacteroidales bacterium]|nr:hypothetical protein [Bacteroidales bacterium]